MYKCTTHKYIYIYINYDKMYKCLCAPPERHVVSRRSQLARISASPGGLPDPGPCQGRFGDEHLAAARMDGET